MITEMELKARLQEVKQNGYQLPATPELEQLLAAMTAYIGSVDAELRDELIYTTFARWILRQGLPEPLLHQLFSTALDDNHLFFGLGESAADSVFTRSFSLLLLALLLIAHRSQPYLSAEEVLCTKERILFYTMQERDRRGQVEGKGWAHSVAHTSDVLDELARCAELQAADLREILAAIQYLVINEHEIYNSEEDERLSVGTVAVLERHLLPLVEWQLWIEQFVTQFKETQTFLPGFCKRVNAKQFLRSVYFRVQKPELADIIAAQQKEQIMAWTSEAIRQLTRF